MVASAHKRAASLFKRDIQCIVSKKLKLNKQEESRSGGIERSFYVKSIIKNSI